MVNYRNPPRYWSGIESMPPESEEGVYRHFYEQFFPLFSHRDVRSILGKLFESQEQQALSRQTIYIPRIGRIFPAETYRGDGRNNPPRPTLDFKPYPELMFRIDPRAIGASGHVKTMVKYLYEAYGRRPENWPDEFAVYRQYA